MTKINVSFQRFLLNYTQSRGFEIIGKLIDYMDSRILQMAERYGSFENILPEDLLEVDFSQLDLMQAELKKIIKEDLESVRKLSDEKNKNIDFGNYRNPHHLVKVGFFLEGDPHQEDEKFYSAHLYMGMVTLEILTGGVIDLSKALLNYYQIYQHPNTTNHDKKFNYNRYSRTWMDFYGNMVNIRQSIYQYYDLFIRTINKIDPENKKNPYYAFKSDSNPDGLYAAVKELLLLGNRGRLEGFQLLRSMIEIHVTRELFKLTNSKKYKDKKVEFNSNTITSVKAICNSIDRLSLSEVFKTDNISGESTTGEVLCLTGVSGLMNT